MGGVMLPEVTVTPQYKEGGSIHIVPSKKGTFTASATKHGKIVQSFASQVLANKENYLQAMVKNANFTRNAAHWHSVGCYFGIQCSNQHRNQPADFLTIGDRESYWHPQYR